MSEPRQITEIARKQPERFLADEACHFLDCAVRLMASSMPMRDVIKRLRDEAEMLEEFG